MIDGLVYDWNRDQRAAAAAHRDARRRDAARRPAVAVGADPVDRRQAAHPPPHRHARHPHRRHRPARRRRRRRAATSSGWPARSAASGCRWRPTAPPAPSSTTSGRSPRSSSAPGVPIEACAVHRQLADPAVRRGLDARLAAAQDRRRDHASRSSEGLPVMYVTEDTTRAHPDTLRALYRCAIHAGASRICVADTVGFATPVGAAAVVRFVASGDRRSRRRRSASTGTATAIATWRWPAAWRRSTPARPACTARRWASASGSATRRWTCCWSTWCCSGYLERDLLPLDDYCRTVSRACGVPMPDNYPVLGRDAFRTATGVHAAAVVKAARKGDRALMDAVYSAIPAGHGRPRAGDRDRPDVGPVERHLLAARSAA